jgi:hypothetical protein
VNSPPDREKIDRAKIERYTRGQAAPELRHSCGHATTPVKVANAHCPECVSASRKARAAGRNRYKQGRLPDGSKFAVRYEARRTRWNGVLLIPTGGPKTPLQPYKQFGSHGRTLLELLEKLDGMFRDWVADGRPVGVSDDVSRGREAEKRKTEAKPHRPQGPTGRTTGIATAKA